MLRMLLEIVSQVVCARCGGWRSRCARGCRWPYPESSTQASNPPPRQPCAHMIFRNNFWENVFELHWLGFRLPRGPRGSLRSISPEPTLWPVYGLLDAPRPTLLCGTPPQNQDSDGLCCFRLSVLLLSQAYPLFSYLRQIYDSTVLVIFASPDAILVDHPGSAHYISPRPHDLRGRTKVMLKPSVPAYGSASQPRRVHRPVRILRAGIELNGKIFQSLLRTLSPRG